MKRQRLVLKRAAIVLGALDNDVRFEICVLLIEKGPVEFAELRRLLAPIKQPALSMNLRVLERAKLIAVGQAGRQRNDPTKKFTAEHQKIETVLRCANALASISPGELTGPG